MLKTVCHQKPIGRDTQGGVMMKTQPAPPHAWASPRREADNPKSYKARQPPRATAAWLRSSILQWLILSWPTSSHLVHSSPAQKAKTGCSKKSKTRRLSGGNLQKIQIRSGKIFERIASIKNHRTVFRDRRVIEGGMVGQDCNAIHRLKQVGCQLNGFEGLTADDN